ncbi:MAG: purine-nucleoside phosphorylase [Christensenella sp.]|uniref:purine-nucleoside phosphorylase n=1 Tax=Christensenella sp. TaxID=1935934 RepID=UPI002B1E9CAE|nr:purine-nucleoside phosphorylase [Christensenella sp.]MEA5002912.1 purine-nucleoside phosphorylase [Christensenella sp.]
MKEKLNVAKSYIESKTDFKPEIAIVLGSGLGDYADTLDEVVMEFDYASIPGFPVSTAPGHASKLTFGCKKGKCVALFAGRFHCYEGYTAAETVIPLRTILMMGAKYVLLTNAAGGINTDFSAGDLMVVEDHINFSAHNALTGPNIEDLGPRFPDMSFAYAKELRNLIDESAKENGIDVQHGIYGYMVGPSYETPAEIRALRTLGADAVGMSTVHEVVAASHAGAKTAAISCISNLAAGVAKHALTMEEVIEAGKMVAGKMRALIDGVVEKIG